MKLTKQMIEMRSCGATYQEIGDKLVCSESSVRRAFNKHGLGVGKYRKNNLDDYELHDAVPDCGIPLKNVPIFSHKPQDKMKGLIYKLPQNKGFPINELSSLWGMSTDTIKKHAKRLKAYSYVEVDPGNYVACVIHPKTIQTIGDY